MSGSRSRTVGDTTVTFQAGKMTWVVRREGDRRRSAPARRARRAAQGVVRVDRRRSDGAWSPARPAASRPITSCWHRAADALVQEHAAVDGDRVRPRRRLRRSGRSRPEAVAYGQRIARGRACRRGSPAPITVSRCTAAVCAFDSMARVILADRQERAVGGNGAVAARATVVGRQRRRARTVASSPARRRTTSVPHDAAQSLTRVDVSASPAPTAACCAGRSRTSRRRRDDRRDLIRLPA